MMIHVLLTVLFTLSHSINFSAIGTVQDKTEGQVRYEIFEVTAYTAGIESTGKRKGDPGYGITASGKQVRENHTIACPRSMDFGTKVYIPFFDNVFTCEDRGSSITEGKLDVFMQNLTDALEFGRRKLAVQILKGGEAQ